MAGDNENNNTQGGISARARLRPGNIGNVSHQVGQAVAGEELQDDASVWENAGYTSASTIFKNDDFDWDTIEDASQGDPMREDVIKAAKLMKEMTLSDDGESLPHKSDDEWIDYAKSQMSWFSQNTVGLTRWATRLATEDDTPRGMERKKAFGFLMKVHEHTNTSWEDVGNFLWKGLLADPTTYIGIGTLGVGTAAAQGGKLAAKQAIKTLMKKALEETVEAGVKKGISTAVKAEIRHEASKAYVKGAVKAGAKYMVFGAGGVTSTVSHVATELTKTKGIRAGLNKAWKETLTYNVATKGLKTALQDGWKTGATKIAVDGAMQGAYFDAQMQRANIAIGTQEEYNGWQTAISGAFGVVAGEGMGVGMKGLGAAGNKAWTGLKEFPANYAKTQKWLADNNVHQNAIISFPKFGRNRGANVGGQAANNAVQNAANASSRVLRDPGKTLAHYIYGGTWKSKSLAELGMNVPSNAVGKWLVTRRIKLANPFYTLPATKLPFLGRSLVGNPSNFLPNRISMGRHIRTVIHHFDGAIQKSGLVDIGNKNKAGPLHELTEKIKAINTSNYTGVKADKRTAAINDAVKIIDDFAADPANQRKLQQFQDEILRAKHDLAIEKQISEIMIEARTGSGSTYTSKASNYDATNNPNGIRLTDPNNPFKDIDDLNNHAKNVMFDLIKNANTDIQGHVASRNALPGYPTLKLDDLNPTDYVKRLSSAAAGDRGVTVLEPHQVKSLQKMINSSYSAVDDLLNTSGGQSIYGKNYRDFMENGIKDFSEHTDEDFFNNQFLLQLKEFTDMAGDNAMDRMLNQQADSFSDNPIRNISQYNKRTVALSEIRRLERRIIDGGYTDKKTVFKATELGEAPNAENFGIRIETAKIENKGDIAELAMNSYRIGNKEEALYALQYLKYRAGANSQDAIMKGIADAIESKAPKEMRGHANEIKDPDFIEFVKRIRAIDDETYHSPQAKAQRHTLAKFAEHTYPFRMARRFPGKSEISFPGVAHFIFNPLIKNGLDIPSYFIGGHSVEVSHEVGKLTKRRISTSGKSLSSFGKAKLPEGFKIPEGKTYTNENNWFRRALWWEKKGTTNYEGDTKNWFGRSPVWFQTPLRVAGAPLALGYRVSKINLGYANNPFIKPVITTMAGAGTAWWAVGETREHFFNDGHDYDTSMPWNDGDRKYFFGPMTWAADKALVMPLRMGLNGTYRITDSMMGDILPDLSTLEDGDGNSYTSYLNLYDRWKDVTSAEIGGYSILDWPGASQSFRNPEELANNIKTQDQALQTLLDDANIQDLITRVSTGDTASLEVLKAKGSVVPAWEEARDAVEIANKEAKKIHSALKELTKDIQDLQNFLQVPANAEPTAVSPADQAIIDAQKALDTANANIAAETNPLLKDDNNDALMIAQNNASTTLKEAQNEKIEQQTELEQKLTEFAIAQQQLAALGNHMAGQQASIANIIKNTKELENNKIIPAGSLKKLETNSSDLIALVTAIQSQSPDAGIDNTVKPDEKPEETKDETVVVDEKKKDEKPEEEKNETVVVDEKKKDEKPEETKDETVVVDSEKKDEKPEEEKNEEGGLFASAKETFRDVAGADFGEAGKSLYNRAFNIQTGDAAIDNTIQNVGTMIWNGVGGVADWGKNTYRRMKSTSSGRTILSAGGGFLGMFLAGSMINKWLDKTWIGKVPFLGSAVKLIISAAMFLVGFKVTNGLIQGKGSHADMSKVAPAQDIYNDAKAKITATLGDKQLTAINMQKLDVSKNTELKAAVEDIKRYSKDGGMDLLRTIPADDITTATKQSATIIAMLQGKVTTVKEAMKAQGIIAVVAPSPEPAKTTEVTKKTDDTETETTGGNATEDGGGQKKTKADMIREMMTETGVQIATPVADLDIEYDADAAKEEMGLALQTQGHDASAPTVMLWMNNATKPVTIALHIDHEGNWVGQSPDKGYSFVASDLVGGALDPMVGGNNKTFDSADKLRSLYKDNDLVTSNKGEFGLGEVVSNTADIDQNFQVDKIEIVYDTKDKDLVLRAGRELSAPAA